MSSRRSAPMAKHHVRALSGLNPNARRGSQNLNPPSPAGLSPSPNWEEQELFRHSPALALANHILRDEQDRVATQMRKAFRPEEEPSLADLFISSTYTLGQSCDTAWARKRV